MDEHKKWSYKILSTLGVLLHLVFVDLARDFIRWINLKPKYKQPLSKQNAYFNLTPKAATAAFFYFLSC